jgi:hypothetical protein
VASGRNNRKSKIHRVAPRRRESGDELPHSEALSTTHYPLPTKFFSQTLDTTDSGVKIGAMNQNCTSWLAVITRMLCVAAAVCAKKVSGTICAKHPTGRSGKWFLTPFSLCVACAVWFASGDRANAGVIVATDAWIGSMSAPQTPVAPEPAKPSLRKLDLASLLSSTTNTSGAGSPAPSFGPSAGLVALSSDVLVTAPNTLISRLSLFSRLTLPSPLEDRFFRPPRV